MAEKKNEILQQLSGAFVKEDNELVYRKVRYAVNGKKVYSVISNPFIFLKEYKRLIYANNVNYGKIKSIADKFYNEQLKDRTLSDSQSIVLREYLDIILFEKHKIELLAIINKHKQFKPVYEIVQSPYDPKIYSEIYDGEPTSKEKIRSSSYLFEIKNGEKDNQPLDSNPEKVIFDKIYDFVLSDNNRDKVKIWAKNFTSSNISGEYLDDSQFVRNSYFDFVIKFSNGYFHTLKLKARMILTPRKQDCLKLHIPIILIIKGKGIYLTTS